MAISKTAITIASAVSVSSGGTKTSPAYTSSTFNTGTYYGGVITYRITNPGSTLTAAAYLVYQISQDGSDWYDYQMVGSDLVASSINMGTVPLPRGCMYLRLIAYNNSAAVTVSSYLQTETAL